MSRLPVLIPARNEADCIARTLESLPVDVEPIIITNNCTDDTTKVAEGFGVTVLKNDEAGKLPALQTGLKYLGSRALNTVLLLDADSQPVTRRWASLMEHASLGNGSSTPKLAGGLVYFARNIDPVSGLIYSLKPVLDANRTGKAHIRGANIAMTISDSDLLDRILDLPNYWPGVEPAIVDTFENFGGEVAQLFDIRAMVTTDGSRLTTLLTRFRHGGQYTHNHFVDSYQVDAPAGSIAYPSIMRVSES